MACALWNQFNVQFKLCLEALPRHKQCVNLLVDQLKELEKTPNITLVSYTGFPINLLYEEAIKITFGNYKKTEGITESKVPYIATPYYFQIDLDHPDIPKETRFISEFIKKVVLSHCISNKRHIIVINGLDKLPRKLLESFKILFELYANNVCFICTTQKPSNIDISLLSRLMFIRIRLPTEEEIVNVLKLLLNEEPKIKIETRNLTRVLLSYNYIITNPDYNINMNYPPITTEFMLNMSLEKCRELSYKLMQFNLTISEITEDLIKELKKKKRDIGWFINKAANIDHMLSKTEGGRAPLYIEKLIIDATMTPLIKK